MQANEIVEARIRFHELYYGLAPITWDNTFYLGKKCWKNPLDLWVMQEIIYELQPDFLIETGTYQGGSALFYADIMSHVGRGTVITIDINPVNINHPRIFPITGSSIDPRVVTAVHDCISGEKSLDEAVIMVDLDSDHTESHVFEELDIYSQFVNIGSYLIVEDTNVGGPAAAVQKFLKMMDGKIPSFIQDRSKEKFLMTFNPGGWLRRIR